MSVLLILTVFSVQLIAVSKTVPIEACYLTDCSLSVSAEVSPNSSSVVNGHRLEINVRFMNIILQNDTVKNDSLILVEPNTYPVFIDGGDAGLKRFINQNLQYPKSGECISGRVFVGFMVDTLGNVNDIEIKKGLTPAANEEAIWVVKMLKFIPGTSFGKIVEMKMV